jgi:starch-binding outer membrane protein, SusD/RagB family
MRTHSSSIQLRRAMGGVTLAAVMAVTGCNFDITNPNSPTSIGPNATAAQVDAASVGLLASLRIDYANWVLKAAIMGREGYRLDTADPRFTTELLAGPLDPSNNAFGGGQWQPEYRTIAAGNTILNVIGSAQITAAEQSGVKGFVETIQALSFLNILNAHTEDSIPIDVNLAVGGPLAKMLTNDSAFKRVVALLDAARTDLQAAGTSFVFDPGPGFVGFKTPANFLTFNRALMARVRAYQASLGALPGPIVAGYGTVAGWSACPACYDSVLTALNASFVSTASPLDLGVYNQYSTGNQDLPNALSQDPGSAINLAHPAIKDSAELQVGGAARDLRFLAKVTTRPQPFSLACLTSDLSWTRYPTPNAAIPIIRNEELILLRAEANWFATTGNKTNAISDINFIRQTSGGLNPTTVTTASTDAQFVNELLKQRLYSLLYEGGHRWIDMRRFGRLSQVLVDRPTGCPSAGIPKDTVFSRLPINSFEVQARQ